MFSCLIHLNPFQLYYAPRPDTLPSFCVKFNLKYSKYLNSFLSSVLTTAPHHAMAATPASGWQSWGDVVDAIVLSLRLDNPTKSLTHAICLNLSAKLSAALHRRSAPSYVCAGLSIRTADEQGSRRRSCSIQVPNEVSWEGREEEGTRCLIWIASESSNEKR